MPRIRRLQRALITVVVVGFALWVLVELIRQVLWALVVILIAFILAAALTPAVHLLRRAQLPPKGWRVPKALAVLIVYIANLAALGVAAYVVGRPLVGDLLDLLTTLPDTVATITQRLDAFGRSLGLSGIVPPSREIFNQVQSLSSEALKVVRLAGSAANVLLTLLFRFFIVITLALFLVAESDRILRFWVNLFPPYQQHKVHGVTVRVGEKVGYWLLGQVAVAATVGTLAGVAAFLLGLPYALLIGLMTAVLDLAPVLGPGLMAIPVSLLGLSQSLLTAVLAGVAFLALAQLDGNVISPLITGRAVRLSPALIIVSVTLGLALYGAIGALLAIPVAAALQVIVQEILLPALRKQEAGSARERDKQPKEG